MNSMNFELKINLRERINLILKTIDIDVTQDKFQVDDCLKIKMNYEVSRQTGQRNINGYSENLEPASAGNPRYR